MPIPTIGATSQQMTEKVSLPVVQHDRRTGRASDRVLDDPTERVDEVDRVRAVARNDLATRNLC